MKSGEMLLNTVLQDFREENNINGKKATKLTFDYFTISQVLKHLNIDICDIDEGLVDGGLDGGIDYIGIFINDKLLHSLEELNEFEKELTPKTELDIYIIQNKDQNSFKESVFEKLIPTFKDIFNYELGEDDLKKIYNLPLIEKILLLRDSTYKVLTKSTNVTLHVIYACKGDTQNISEGVKHKKNSLEDSIKKLIPIPNIKTNILGANELRTLYINRIEDELILKYDHQMSFESDDQNNSGYIATINLKDYFNFVTIERKIRESILESNIRYFQGNVTVNKGINNTLLKNKDLQFWWLNNGITILVSEITPLPNGRLKLKDPQIVNGLQTTFCIVEYLKSNYDLVENRTVLVKIIKTNDSKNIDKIISSTNSQTEVRAADLRATDSLQRDIEYYFLSKGYYYDRRKNYYKNMKVERNKIFNIAKTAQYIETILFKKPHTARSNPTTLLKGNDNYKRIFNEKTNIDAYLKSCIIFKNIDFFIKELDDVSDIIYTNLGVTSKIFTFHIMLIVVHLKIGKININSDELSTINIDQITKEDCIKSTKILLESIKTLINNNPKENVVALAKSKILTEQILKNVKESINK